MISLYLFLWGQCGTTLPAGRRTYGTAHTRATVQLRSLSQIHGHQLEPHRAPKGPAGIPW